MRSPAKPRVSLSFFGNTIIILILALLSLLFILKLIDSLNWRLEHDTPLLQYAAFMMVEYQAVPYRDFFDTNFPGTYLFHYIIGSLLGFSDTVFLTVNALSLLMLMLCMYMTIRQFGWISAWSGSVLFGLVYLSGGGPMILQRDYLGIIPIAVAFMLIPHFGRVRSRYWHFLITGIFFGLASTIKPHLLITAPVALYALWNMRYRQINYEEPDRQRSGQTKQRVDKLTDGLNTGLIMLAGIVTVWTPIVIWLIRTGAWKGFLEFTFVYIPLYSKITGTQRVLIGWQRIGYFFDSLLKFSGLGYLVLAGLFGWFNSSYFHRFAGRKRLVSRMIFYCAILYGILYPALAGKFWPYHYMPMIYFMIPTAVLAFADSEQQHPNDFDGLNEKESKMFQRLAKWKNAWVAVIIFLAFSMQLNLPNEIITLMNYRSGKIYQASPVLKRVDQIALWLALHAKPGDTVQPLDWTGGAVHGMLEAKVPLATRFMYDYHFFHHVSHPFIQRLREEFIQSLYQKPPRFMIEIETDRPRVSGKDTSSDFPELKKFVVDNYQSAYRDAGYAILERKDKNSI